MDWKPIKTVPKDGSWIVIAKYEGSVLAWLHKAAWSAHGWVDMAGDYISRPTHWDYQPAAPAAQL